MQERKTYQGMHAVVLGGSMAGLLAARALHGHFATVTLVERDALPVGPEHRKGVPQSRHTHALLAAGAEVMESYFPGFQQELLDAGAPSGDAGRNARLIASGYRCQRCETGRRGITVSRPLLESVVRRRVLDLPGVRLLDGHDVLGIATADDGQRVSGTRIATRDALRDERLLAADLVVDATGRGSRTPDWLSQLGFPSPQAASVRIGVSYVTRLFRRRPTDLDGDISVIMSAAPPNRRTGAALAQEGDRWTVTLAGYLGEQVPVALDGFIEYAGGLPAPDIYDLISRAEPLGDAVTARYPASIRHYYERLRRFPQRYVVVGDAICGFNPIFGQGMSVAAFEARALDASVAEGLNDIGRRFFRRAARIVDTPWNVVVGNDLRFPEVEGRRPLGMRLVNAYMTRYLQAATQDPVLSQAYHSVGNLVLPPERLMSPALLSRVVLRRRPPPQDAPSIATGSA